MHALRPLSRCSCSFPTPPRQQDATPTLHVNTNLTIVDVTVTDKSGHPVHGLKQSDFIVKEDGKPQPIKNFDEFGTSIPPAQPAHALPPGIYTNQPKPTPTTSATNIILLDNVVMGDVHAHPELFMYSKAQAQSYIKSLPPGTPVALMENADKLLLLQDVTTDRNVLLAAIDKVAFKAIPGVTLFPPVSALDRHSSAEHDASASGQARLTFTALTQIAAYAAGIKGRKNLIWLTPGIPWLTNFAQFGNSSIKGIPTAGIPNLEQQMQHLYGLLNAAQVSIYTIDSHGLETDVTAVTPSVSNPSSNFIQRSYRHESLQDFAEATGGKAYLNRNDLDAAIADAVATGSDYYSISYIPPRSKYDDQFHAINVTLKNDPARPGLHLQYEKGYTAIDLAHLNRTVDYYAATVMPSTLPPEIAQFHTGMAHGAAPSTQLLLATRIAPTVTPTQAAAAPIKGDLNPAIKTNPLIRFDIAYSIPAGQLTVANNSASVELDIIAYAEDGTKLNVIRQTANINLKPEQVAAFQQKPFQVPLQLDLPPGKLFLRIGALDVPSGKYGTLEVPQTVAKP